MKKALLHYKYHILIFVFLITYLIIAFKINIWVDECFSLNTASKHSLKEIIQTSIIFEAQPPLYFLLLSYWLKISSTLFFARTLSVLLIILSVFVIRKLVQLTHNIDTVWLTALFLLNPFFFWASSESRCYALVIFFSALLSYIFYSTYVLKNKPRRLIYILVAIIAVNTQYFVAIFLVSNAVHLIFIRDWKSFRNYILDMLPVIISIGWVIPFLNSEVVSHVGDFSSKQSFLEILKFLPSRIDNYIFAGYLFPFKSIRYFLFAGLVIFIFINLKKESTARFFTKNNIFITQAVVCGLSFLMIYPILGDDLLARRHSAIMFIPWLVCFFLIVQELSLTKKTIALSVLALCYLLSNINTYSHPVKDFDVKNASGYILAHESENEPVLVYNNQIGMPIQKYYNGVNNLIVFPDTIKDTEPFDYTFLNRDIKTDDLSKILTKYEIGQDPFWVVYPDIAANMDNLNRLIELIHTKYTTIDSCEFVDHKPLKTYDGITVRKLKLREIPK